MMATAGNGTYAIDPSADGNNFDILDGECGNVIAFVERHGPDDVRVWLSDERGCNMPWTDEHPPTVACANLGQAFSIVRQHALVALDANQ